VFARRCDQGCFFTGAPCEPVVTPAPRRAQLYFAEEGDESGQWWTGTVLEDAQDAPGAAEAAAAADPWAIGGLWERYRVAWDGQAGPAQGLFWSMREADAQRERPARRTAYLSVMHRRRPAVLDGAG
jgi:hypothetical protein